MNSPAADASSRRPQLRWWLALAFVLLAAVVLGAGAHGTPRAGRAAGLWQVRSPLVTASLYPPRVRATRGTRPVGQVRLQRPGCPAPLRVPRRNGRRDARVVALTFDDGPSLYTHAVVRALRRAGANATFFVVGIHIAGRERTLRR